MIMPKVAVTTPPIQNPGRLFPDPSYQEPGDRNAGLDDRMYSSGPILWMADYRIVAMEHSGTRTQGVFRAHY